MTEPDSRQVQGSSRRWVNLVITSILIAVVVLSATAAIYSRNAWWESYLTYIHGVGK